MDAWMLSEERVAASAARKKPAAPQKRIFTADGDGRHGREAGPKPTELFLEATDPTGEMAIWFDDIWWTESLRRWGELPLVIHILPSQAALLHPVVLHQVAMVKRVCPNWRVVGHAYRGEISGDAAIERLATSAYDEVRFVEAPRPNSRGPNPLAHALRTEDLFKQVRRMQKQLGATRPVLVRAKMIPPAPGDGAGPQTGETEADMSEALVVEPLPEASTAVEKGDWLRAD